MAKMCYDESYCDKNIKCEECEVYLYELQYAKNITNCNKNIYCGECEKYPCIKEE